MNRIFALMIASTLIIAGSNVFAQKTAKSPRRVQQTEEIVYAIERSSEVPRYRGHREPSIIDAPKNAPAFGQVPHSYADAQHTTVLTPFTPTQVTESAPVIPGSSRLITRSQEPTPASEIFVTAPVDTIDSSATRTEIVKTRTPANASPNFRYRSPFDNGQQDSRQSQRTPRPNQIHSAEEVVLSLPFEQSQVTESAPVIPSSSRLITRIRKPSPATETFVTVPDTIDPSATRTEVVTTRTPANASPNFRYRSPTDFGQEGLQQSQGTRRPNPFKTADEIARSLPFEQPQATEVAPVIPRSSRRITKVKESTPTTETLVTAPVRVDPAATRPDFVTTRTPAKASPFNSPKFKYRSPAGYGEKDLRQSQWKPRPNQVRRAREVAISSPNEQPALERLPEIGGPDLVKIVSSAFAAENNRVAVPAKAATSGSEERSPLTSFVAETSTPPAAEIGDTRIKTESKSEVVAPIVSATTRLRTKAELSTVPSTRSVRTSAGEESSRQEVAAGAWWFILPLLVVPVLALLGWALLDGRRDRQYEEIPAIDIPMQKSSPWQRREGRDAELSGPVESENSSWEFGYTPEESAVKSETELLDEINSIRAIPSDSNSAPNLTSDRRAKSKK